MSTRGALATMPVSPSALRNWALCARTTAAPRKADGWQGHSVRGQGLFVFHSSGPVRGNGQPLRELHTHSVLIGAACPASRGRREVYEATQDHPLRR